MNYVKILRNGQITLPKKMRDKLNTSILSIQFINDTDILLHPLQEENKKTQKNKLLNPNSKWAKLATNGSGKWSHEDPVKLQHEAWKNID